jgi:4-amino-4-deoxy-L-arabinose transferase-like glycosyltransferase
VRDRAFLWTGIVMSAYRRIGKWLLDGLWLIGLGLYVIAGYKDVPFHGDESTLIFMSKDYAYLVQQHDLDRVLYRDPPVDPTEQELRLLNGTVGKMAMGVAWDLAGFHASDINDGWAWGEDWWTNVALGHIPKVPVWRAARLSSTLLTVISVWAVFGIARLAARNRPAAYAASLIYVTTPAVLLNGRRAMMEGSMLCFSALAALAALVILREQARVERRGRTLTAWYAVFGVACGFALASKHNTLIMVGAMFLAVAVEPVVVRRWTESTRDRFKSELWRHSLRLVEAGVLTVLVFLALNPAWWSDPLGMPERVATMRRDMLNAQIASNREYSGWDARASELVKQAFFAAPQYYEVGEWKNIEYIVDQIRVYEGMPWTGRLGGPVWGVPLVIAFGLGIVELIGRWRDGPAGGALLWVGVTALALLISTPFAWQRYYLPLQAPLAVVAGAGVWRAGRYVVGLGRTLGVWSGVER